MGGQGGIQVSSCFSIKHFGTFLGSRCYEQGMHFLFGVQPQDTDCKWPPHVSDPFSLKVRRAVHEVLLCSSSFGTVCQRTAPASRPVEKLIRPHSLLLFRLKSWPTMTAGNSRESSHCFEGSGSRPELIHLDILRYARQGVMWESSKAVSPLLLSLTERRVLSWNRLFDGAAIHNVS